MIHSARIRRLVDVQPCEGGRYVLYWMQASQRTCFNHALEFAAVQANELGLPLVVGFGLMDDYPEANARHYHYMLQGLADVAGNLAKRHIRFVIRHGNPAEVAIALLRHAAAVVCDRGYLRHQKLWRAALAEACSAEARPLTQIETDAVVPVESASEKREYAARTIRPRIHRKLAEFMHPLAQTRIKQPADSLSLKSDFDLSDPGKVMGRLKLDTSVAPVPQYFTGGENAAHASLRSFLANQLSGYAEGRNEPAADHSSHMSAHLHFGHISPLELALEVAKAGKGTKEKTPQDSGLSTQDSLTYLEELIIRRELAINFCETTDHYDSYDALPGWAKQTLKDHKADSRPHIYTRQQLERAETFDPYWNAAQTEMLRTGFMQNYMRMYWGKKILEWTADLREAHETTLYLNNKYFLCGRSPNAYSNVAWIYGLHDRPWGPARKIFGTVRYMNSAGLERKFDMEGYVARVNALE